MKVATRNNLLTKLATSKWGANPSTIRTTALALSYSTTEYVAPVWERSRYAKNLDPSMLISHIMSKANVKELYLLTEIFHPAIRRDVVCARMERQKQSTRETYSLFCQIPATKRLKSRNYFLSGVQPANFPAKVIRCSEWRKRLRNKPHMGIINLLEKMARGHDKHGPRENASTVCARGTFAA